MAVVTQCFHHREKGHPGNYNKKLDQARGGNDFRLVSHGKFENENVIKKHFPILNDDGISHRIMMRQYELFLASQHLYNLPENYNDWRQKLSNFRTSVVNPTIESGTRKYPPCSEFSKPPESTPLLTPALGVNPADSNNRPGFRITNADRPAENIPGPLQTLPQVAKVASDSSRWNSSDLRMKFMKEMDAAREFMEFFLPLYDDDKEGDFQGSNESRRTCRDCCCIQSTVIEVVFWMEWALIFFAVVYNFVCLLNKIPRYPDA